MIFFNDHQERESYYVQHYGRIAQIAGISEQAFQEKYDGCWQQLNRDLYGGEFSEECKYGESAKESSMKKQMTYSEAQELVRNLYFNSIFPQNFLENVDADSIVSENGLCEEDAEEIEYALLEIRDNAFLKDYSYDECTPLFEKGHLTAFGRVYRHGDSFFYAIVDTQEQDFEEIFTSESDASDFIRNQLEAL